MIGPFGFAETYDRTTRHPSKIYFRSSYLMNTVIALAISTMDTIETIDYKETMHPG